MVRRSFTHYAEGESGGYTLDLIWKPGQVSFRPKMFGPEPNERFDSGVRARIPELHCIARFVVRHGAAKLCLLKIKVKRVKHDEGDDGGRVFVDRLWPRGGSKWDAAPDVWIKNNRLTPPYAATDRERDNAIVLKEPPGEHCP